MSPALPLLFTLSLAAGDGKEAIPAWCLKARERLERAQPSGDEAWPSYLAVVEHLPREADPVIEDARRRVGEGGALDDTLAAIQLALEDGCEARPALAGGSPSRQVEAILARDERFEGERAERSLVEEWRARFAAWLQRLFESQLMRSYAGASRALYLSALGLFIAFVAVRLWRARVRGRASSSKREEALAVIERARRLAFREHRQEAALCLEEGDLRGALRFGQLALLARIGEVDARAITPARTNREVLRRLDEERRALVEPPLKRFERAFYGGEPIKEAFVRSFLDDVDAAASALGGQA